MDLNLFIYARSVLQIEHTGAIAYNGKDHRGVSPDFFAESRTFLDATLVLLNDLINSIQMALQNGIELSH